MRRLIGYDFDVSTGQSAKYRLAITIRNDGPTAVSGFQVTFAFDAIYGGVAQGDNVTGWTKSLGGNTIIYTRQAGFPLAPGASIALTTDVNTGSFSTANIDATTVSASGVVQPGPGRHAHPLIAVSTLA